MKKFIFFTVLGLMGTYASAQSKALASVVDDDKMYGFINEKGEMVIPAKFEKTGNFSDNLAAASNGDHWGFIDTKGAWAIEPKFDHVKPFDSGVALVELEGEWMYIDRSGKKLDIAQGDKLYGFNDGVAFVRVGESVGLMNTKGKLIVEPKYKKITNFHNGYARFLTSDDKWGIIDNQGNVVVEAKYDDIGDYSSKVAWVRNGEQMGLVSGNNYTQIDAVKIWNFPSNGTLTYAEKNDLIGFVDKKGTWVIPPTFEKAKAFSNGLAPAYDGENWGFVDESGKFVIAPQYEDVIPFSEDGLAPVKLDRDWGFINAQGKLVIEATYEITVRGKGFGFVSAIFNNENKKGFINGIARIGRKREVGFIDKQGNLLGNTWYRQAKPFVKID